MTKARTNASVAPAVGRNMIINGAMNLSQRAVSVTGLGAASGYFTVDRWKILRDATAGRFTMTQTADGPNGISANCLKLDCTTADASIAAGEHIILRQPIEGQNVQRIGKGVVGAKQVTVSFYVKASASFTFGCELFDVTAERQCTKLFSTTTDWVRHEIIFPADVDDGSSPFNDDNSAELFLSFILHAGSTFTSGNLNTSIFNNLSSANRAPGIDSFFSNTANNFFITGVQMEVGPVATEFEQEDITTTLQKCYRYYTKLVSDGTNVLLFGAGQGFSANGVFGDYNYPVTMRSRPTALEQTGTAADYKITDGSGTSTECTAVPTFGSSTSKHAAAIVYTCSGGSAAGEANGMFLAPDGFLAWSAEL